MSRLLKWTGRAVAMLVILLALSATIIPRFLDRRYYQGPASGHYDGERFFNPGGEDDTARPPSGGSRAGFFWRQLAGDDRPVWPERVTVRPSRPPARVEGDRMVATWVGHATVLVQTGGLNILTDPIWSDRAGPLGLGPTRVAEPGIRFEDLPRIDLVLVSHNHYDHLDLATLKRLWARDRPVIVTPLGNDSVIRQAGAEAVALDWGGGFQRASICAPGGSCPTIDVAVIRNHHWGSRWFTDRNRALWSSFVVRLPGGNLFFAGDTGLGDGRWAADAAALGPIRLALIPIGAFRFVPGQMQSASHIGPPQAVEVFRSLGASTAIPIHWGTFRLSYEAWNTPPRLLRAAMNCSARNRPQNRFAPVRIGQAVEVPPVRAIRQPLLAERSAAAIERCLDTPAVRALR